MDPTNAAVLACALLLTLLALRVPVAISLLVSGGIGILLLDGARVAEAALGRGVYTASARYILIVIPFFLAMGVFVRYAGLAEVLFGLASRLFRRVPGGLAVAAIAACAGFAAISGTSVATVAGVGSIALEEMRKWGYSKTVAAGVVGAAGTLGAMIPPSAMLVMYGIVAGESIGRLLIAGIVPGVLSAIVYVAAILARARRSPEAFGRNGSPSAAHLSVGDMVAGFAKAGLLVVVVVGGIYSGLLTVVEASASGAAIALIYLVARRRKEARIPGQSATVASPDTGQQAEVATLAVGGHSGPYEGVAFGEPGGSVSNAESSGDKFAGSLGSALLETSEVVTPAVGGHSALYEGVASGDPGGSVSNAEGSEDKPARPIRSALLETTELNSMVFLLLVGSGVFSFFLVSANVPQSFAETVSNMPIPPSLVVVALLLLFLPLGMFLDPMSMVLIAVPLTHPVVVELGYSGVWFGILVIKMTELALITPPLGMNAYVLAGVDPELSVGEAFKGLLWYAPLDAITIVVLFLYPSLVLWLPDMAAVG